MIENVDRVLIDLTRSLYPTGRAWNLPVDELFEIVHRTLNQSEGRALNEGSLAILSTLLPDNDNFDEQDATDWERRLQIVVESGTTLVDRKAEILRKYSSPGGVLGRQAASYIESQLQAANFNVFVHEDSGNIEQAIGTRLGDEESRLGNVRLRGSGQFLELIANRVSISDDVFVLPLDRSAVFVISGQNPSDIANVPLVRRNEFRSLILTLKPAHLVGVLLINYT